MLCQACHHSNWFYLVLNFLFAIRDAKSSRLYRKVHFKYVCNLCWTPLYSILKINFASEIMKRIRNADLDIFWDINKDNDTFIREINYQQMSLENILKERHSMVLINNFTNANLNHLKILSKNIILNYKQRRGIFKKLIQWRRQWQNVLT